MRTIVCSMTFAPFVICSGLVNSEGAWLMPPLLGTKIMPIGAMSLRLCASCPAPLGMCIALRPKTSALSWTMFLILSSVIAAGDS